MLNLLFCLWIILASIAIFKTKQIIKKYEKYPQLTYPEHWNGFLRKDKHQWNSKQIIIGSIIRFPFKFIILLLFIIGTFCMVFLTMPLSKFGQKIFKYYGRYIGTLVGKCLLIIHQQNNLNKLIVQAPIVISNHVCWFDIFYLITTFYPISFVSKDQIRTAPIIGKIATNAQTIYLKRQSQTERSSVTQKIKQRVITFLQSAKKQTYQDIYPLIIFPQGTTSNGKSILRFKLGAFSDLAPIMIVSLNYECDNFDMGMVEMSQTQFFLFSLCLNPTLKTKKVFVQALSNEKPEQYCNRCQKILSQMTGYKIYDSGYRQRMQHQQKIKKQIQKLKSH